MSFAHKANDLNASLGLSARWLANGSPFSMKTNIARMNDDMRRCIGDAMTLELGPMSTCLYQMPTPFTDEVLL